MNSSSIKRTVKKALRSLLLVEQRYWKKQFKNDPRIGEYYDELLCYQGVSMSKVLLKYLRRFNRSIKTCVFIGDSANYYNFYSRKALFDKVFTFDIKDAERIPGIYFLDPYWEDQSEVSKGIVYDLSSIGSDHDGRYEFISKVYPQLENTGLKTFIRVVSKKPNIKGLSEEKKKVVLSEWEMKIKSPFVSENAVPFDEFHRIIRASNCILEIERERQSGITIRSMSAIANGRKVITTNEFLKERPFFNPRQITIIDRNNPILDIEWIKERLNFSVPDYLMNLRLDNWVKNLLLEDK